MALIDNVPGVLANPIFGEVVIRGVVTQTDGALRPVLNVLHVRKLNNAAPSNKTNMGAIVQHNFVTPLKAVLASTWAMNIFSSRWLDDPLDAYLDDGTAPAVGAIGTDALPTRSAVTIKLETGVRGRNFRGSKHICPIPEADTIQDEIDPAVLAGYTAIATALKANPYATDGDGNHWGLIIVSQRLSTLTSRPAIITGADVVDAIVNIKIGSMRRRRER